MKKARLNIFKGKITGITRGTMSANLVIELGPGLKLRSRLPARSFHLLNPTRGQMVSVVIPAVDVVVSPI
jgi:molybdopterin-binding protein